MKFNPKKYLSNKINYENCQHQVRTTSGFDDGEYGYVTHHCIICGRTLRVPTFNGSIDNIFIKHDFGFLTTGLVETMIQYLERICLENMNQENVNIAELFRSYEKEIDKEVNEITQKVFNIKTKKKVIDK